MNHTKTQVPRTAKTNARTARPHRVEDGIKSSASKIPNCADEMVAPVVGDTNLFMQSCCIISPATLIPTPVHNMASRRGSREIKKISHCCVSPLNSPEAFTSKTPINREPKDKISKTTARIAVSKFRLIAIPPYFG